MKNFKFSKIIIALILAFTTVLPSVSVFAKSYNDVPTSHWAYKQIDYVTNKGYMSGNTEGSFGINQKVDPFEMSKVLARVAGYKDSANATDVERQSQEQIYSKFKAFIGQYSAFSLWNSTANREIAYLLENGVLTDVDLNRFVVKTQEGYEKLVYPSREDLSLFLVKALEKDSEANSLSTYNKFNDDYIIADSKKPYVYYLRHTNVVSGDSINNFNPNDNVTRAALATILYNVDVNINGVTTNDNGNTTNNNDNDKEEVVVTVVSGTLLDVNKNFNTFKVKHSDGIQKSYILKSNANIYVNNQSASINDLEPAMTISCVVENGTAVTTLRATAVYNPDNNNNNNNNVTDNNNNNNNNNNNVTDNNNNSNVVDNNNNNVPSNLESVTGTIISHLSSNNTLAKAITIEIKTPTYGGGTKTTIESYRVSDNAFITHNGLRTSLSALNTNDRVTLQVSNEKVAYVISSSSRFNVVRGTLTGKKYETMYDYYFTVLPKGAETAVDYKLGENTKYTRNDEENIFYNDIRIGDSVELYLDYDEIIYIIAESTISDDVEGIIKEITINEHFGIVTLSERDNSEENTYTIQHKDFDVYDLKVGSQVVLELDSKEVVDVEIEAQVTKIPVTGIIDKIDSDYITLRTISGYTTVETDFAETVVVNSKTGVTSSRKSLDLGDNVTVYWNDQNSTIVSTIIIN